MQLSTMIFALQREHVALWWITLGLGAVVAVVVIVLLSMLVALVEDIDENVGEAWNTATRVAANTATTWMLQQTVVRTADLNAEVRRHAEFLNQKAAAAR